MREFSDVSIQLGDFVLHGFVYGVNKTREDMYEVEVRSNNARLTGSFFSRGK